MSQSIYVVEWSYDYEGSEAVFASASRGDCFAWIAVEDVKLEGRHGDSQSVTRFSPLPSEVWVRSSYEGDWRHRMLVGAEWIWQ